MKQEEKANTKKNIQLSVPTERVLIKCSLNNRLISEEEARRIVVRAAIKMAIKKQTETKKENYENVYSA